MIDEVFGRNEVWADKAVVIQISATKIYFHPLFYRVHFGTHDTATHKLSQSAITSVFMSTHRLAFERDIRSMPNKH